MPMRLHREAIWEQNSIKEVRWKKDIKEIFCFEIPSKDTRFNISEETLVEEVNSLSEFFRKLIKVIFSVAWIYICTHMYICVYIYVNWWKTMKNLRSRHVIIGARLGRPLGWQSTCLASLRNQVGIPSVYIKIQVLKQQQQNSLWLNAHSA